MLALGAVGEGSGGGAGDVDVDVEGGEGGAGGVEVDVLGELGDRLDGSLGGSLGRHAALDVRGASGEARARGGARGVVVVAVDHRLGRGSGQGRGQGRGERGDARDASPRVTAKRRRVERILKRRGRERGRRSRAATDEGAVEGRARRARRHVTHRRRGEVRVELLHVDVGVVRLDVVHGLGHRRAGGGAGDFFSEEPKKRTRSNRRDGRVGGRGVRVERSKTRTRRARATRGARANGTPAGRAVVLKRYVQFLKKQKTSLSGPACVFAIQNPRATCSVPTEPLMMGETSHVQTVSKKLVPKVMYTLSIDYSDTALITRARDPSRTAAPLALFRHLAE